MPAFCTECGKNRKLNDDCVCSQSSKSAPAGDGAHSSTSEINDITHQEGFADSAYWENMNKLLDAKFKSFEQTFKNTIMEEVKKITDPMAVDLKSLKEENRGTKS